MIGWAKKNPVLAGGIVLVLVLIAWWVSRQGGGGGSSVSVSEDEGALDFGSSGGSFLETDPGGSLLETVSNASDGITQPAPVYDAPVFDALPSVSDMGNAGMFDPGSVQDAVLYAPSSSVVGEALGQIGKEPVSVSGYSKGGGLADGAKKADNVLSMTGASASGTGTTGSRSNVIAPKREGVEQTPAQKLGKGKNFTGYINGVYYVLGYPKATATPAKGITPSAKSPLKRGGKGTTR
jgi:hypothetical protein